MMAKGRAFDPPQRLASESSPYSAESEFGRPVYVAASAGRWVTSERVLDKDFVHG